MIDLSPTVVETEWRARSPWVAGLLDAMHHREAWTNPGYEELVDAFILAGRRLDKDTVQILGEDMDNLVGLLGYLPPQMSMYLCTLLDEAQPGLVQEVFSYAVNALEVTPDSDMERALRDRIVLIYRVGLLREMLVPGALRDYEAVMKRITDRYGSAHHV